MNVYVSMYVYIICIYMERETERGRVSEREKETITAGIARALRLVGSLKS